MEYNKIVLKPGKDKSILRKHPWIFSGAVKRAENPDGEEVTLTDGEFVEVKANKGRHLGYGHYQDGNISVRLLGFDETPDKSILYRTRILNAFKLRRSLGLLEDKETNIYRLVHAEGDNLPGLIIDAYDNNYVVQCHSIGMYLDIDFINSAILNAAPIEPTSIYLKSSSTLGKNYQDYSGDRYLHGEVELPIVALEYGNKFNIDWINGQKTGFFIDQRENRKSLARYSAGKKVLNTFCYSGGFSIFALNAEAEFVHSLDSSKQAIELTNQNVSLNGYNSKKHKSFAEDAMAFIKDLPEEYDVIVLDPPAFAKHKSARHNAIQGYKRLNAHAIRQIKPGGIIFTFSCSQVVDKALFTHTVISAAIAAEREVKILEQLHQPADHPISAFHPEGEYLKGLVIQVL
ncbi:MAG: class I SAM-dependent rRNA methyltransferase [Crocinitomicaceae bacterium]|nr:class I SAM-dependent rRNA methyltransferase [Crocinitomicaceae bacterium]